jgi:ABC-type nitrate/sulfonate/bicarbonate transport system substrate-binding protein
VRGQDVAQILAAQVVVDIGNDPDPLIRTSNCAPRPLTVSADLLRTRPDIVDRFLARVVAAGEWAAENPEGTVRAIAGETGWSEPAVRRSFGPNVHLHLDAGLDPAFIQPFDQFVTYLAKRGFIARDFDVADWIDPGPLDRVRSSIAKINPSLLATA